MVGILRLLLAMTVAAVHFAPSYLSINVVGSATLVAFFIISGYAMTGLYESRFADLEGGIKLFYLDRVLRVTPQYYFWLLIAALILCISRHSQGWHAFVFFQTGAVTPFNLLCNLIIWPMGFWPYSPELAAFQLLPPAWSLTIELTFYALLPWLLSRTWLLYALSAVALAVFCSATHGLVDPTMYAYRVLPVPLLYIVVGHAMYKRKLGLLACLYAIWMIDGITVAAAGKLGLGFNPGVFIGISLGAVLVLGSVRIRGGRFDELCGRASYGCYLGHWPLLMLVHPQPPHPWLMLPFAMAAAALGWVSYGLVDARVLSRRKRLVGARHLGLDGPPLELLPLVNAEQRD